MQDYEFTVLYEKDEDGWIVAKVPALRGCHTQGKTIEEAKEHIKEAIALWIETYGEPVDVGGSLAEANRVEVCM